MSDVTLISPSSESIASFTKRPLHRKPRGRHPDKRLTATRVRNITRAGRYADGNGLYLHVDPSGARRWVLRTLIRGTRRDLGLGGVQLVPLAEAREEAVRLRKIARAGGDPRAERLRERRDIPTFKDAAMKVHATRSATFRNEKHGEQWLSSLARDVFPCFGDHRVDAIEPADILKALTPIWTTKSETARRVKQRIKVVLDWAKASGYRSGDNPVDGMKEVLPRTRQMASHHAALPYAQVPAFLQLLREADASEPTRLAFEFLILTAARTSEVLHATWAEFDVNGKVWTIPGARMKAGREHRVPLSPRAVEILERAKEFSSDGPYVFPGRSPKTPLSNMALLMCLRRMMKRGDLTVHGFRSSFRDWAADRTNAPTAVCEAALAHTIRDKAEAAYNRTDLFDRRRALMDAWERFATAEMADVVSIRA